MSKAKFMARFPNATAERHRTNGGRTYWLVRKVRGDYMPFAEGDTQAKAWADAWKKLESGE